MASRIFCCGGNKRKLHDQRIGAIGIIAAAAAHLPETGFFIQRARRRIVGCDFQKQFCRACVPAHRCGVGD